MSPPDAFAVPGRPPALATVAGFAAALARPDRPPPPAVCVVRGDLASRFAVYRNNVWVARLEAIEALFPVTRRLVGDDFLQDLARRFFTEAPPATPVVQEWAGPFAAWLAASDAVAEWVWIADVAALEAAWLAAHHAAEAAPLGPAALAGLAPERLAAARLRLHPSLALVASAFPIGAIWTAHQGDGEPGPLAALDPECVLVVRPDAEVVVATLAPGEAAFVRALADGVELGEAAEAALAVDPAFDVGDRLTALLRLGAIVGFA
jgi:hypothetical protein